MDFTNRARPTAHAATNRDANVARRERLLQLALETVDLVANPNALRQHRGGFDCHLCDSWHASEAQYLAHTRDAGHEYNLLARMSSNHNAALAQPPGMLGLGLLPPRRQPMRQPTRYSMTARHDPDTHAHILRLQVFCPWSQGDVECDVLSDGDKRYLRVDCAGHKTVDVDLSHHGVVVSRVASWDELSKTLTIEVTFGAS